MAFLGNPARPVLGRVRVGLVAASALVLGLLTPAGAAPSSAGPSGDTGHVISPAQAGDNGTRVSRDPSSPLDLGAASRAARTAKVLGAHKIYLLPIYWDGSKPTPLAESTIADAITSADTYYKAATDSAVTVGSGWNVPDWTKVSLSSSEAASCDLNAIQREARRIVGNAGARDHLVVYVEPTSTCKWTHLETLGLTSYGDGYNLVNGSYNRDLALREIAVNSGAAGTGSLDCLDGTTPVPLSGSCTYRDDTDPWDPVSGHPYGQPGQPMAATLRALGVLTDADYPQITPGETQTITIAPVTATSGKRGFYFEYDGYRYHVDYRVATGLDSWIDTKTWTGPTGTLTDPGGGVIVHRQATDKLGNPRELIDFHPDATKSDTGRHPGLASGESYASPDRFFTIKVSAESATEASVEMSFPTLQKVGRWSGADRYFASATISRANFEPNVPVAYIASGEVYTDALSGAPVAGMNGGPILLVTHDSIPDVIAAELRRLAPQKIVIFGGTATITADVEAELDGLTTGDVTRFSGADRYAASASISAANFDPGVKTAYVASGLIFTDALSGAPLAGKSRGPVLLTATDALPAPIKLELTRLKPERIVVLGGSSTISDNVLSELETMAVTVQRLSGPDRFTTSAQIAHGFYAPPVETVYIASGRVYSDALSGAPVAGMTKGPIMLVDTNALPSAVGDELERLKPAKIVILGGPATVSFDVQAELAQYLP